MHWADTSIGRRQRGGEYFPEDSSDSFLAKLPTIEPVPEAASLPGAMTSSSGPVFREGPPRSTSGARVEHERAVVGYLHPSLDAVRRTASGPKFGTAAGAGAAVDREDMREMLNPDDTAVRAEPKGPRFAPVARKPPEQKRLDIGDPPASSSALLLLPNFAAVERAAPGVKFGSGGRVIEAPPPGNAEDGDAARELERALDAAAAKNRLLPRAAAVHFSQSERFKDAWNHGARGEVKLPPSAGLRDDAAHADRLTRRRAPCVSFGPRLQKQPPPAASRAADGGVPADEEAPMQPLNPSYALLERHAGCPSMRPPSAPRQTRSGAQAEPGPGEYAVGADQQTEMLSTFRRVTGPRFGKPTSAPRKARARCPALPPPKLDTSSGLALVRPRAPSASFGARQPTMPRARRPLPTSSNPGCKDASRHQVSFSLVEPRVPGGASWAAGPATGRAPDKADHHRRQTLPAREKENREPQTPSDALLRRTRPSFSFSTSDRRLRVELMEPPRPALHPNHDFVRPSTTLVLDFSVLSGRDRKGHAAAGGKYVPGLDMGRYSPAAAWRFLQKAIPGPVFAMAERRWDRGTLDALVEGGQEVILELARALKITRPSPPAYSFGVLFPATPRSRNGGLQPFLDVRLTLVKKRTGGGVAAFRCLRGRGEGLRIGPQEWDEVVADEAGKTLGSASASLHEPRFTLVEQSVRTAHFQKDRRGLLEQAQNSDPLPGDVLELDVQAAETATQRRGRGAMVDMSRGTSRVVFSDLAAALTAGCNLPTAELDQTIRPRIIGPAMSEQAPGHQGGLEEAESFYRQLNPKLGPGTYESAVPTIGDAASAAVDFGAGPARGLDDTNANDAVKKIADGDFLVLEVGPAKDATHPRAPKAVIPPGNLQRLILPVRGDGADKMYDASLALVKPQAPEPLNFDKMTQRTDPFQAAGASDEGAVIYNPQDIPEEAIAPWPRGPPCRTGVAFELQGGRRLQGDYRPPGLRFSTELDLEPAERITRRHPPRAMVDMAKQEGRPASGGARVPVLDAHYDPDDTLLKPRAAAGSAIPYCVQQGRDSPLGASDALNDIDAGVYTPSHRLVHRQAPASDFSNCAARRNAQLRDQDEGNMLLLNPRGASGWKQPLAEARSMQPFGRRNDRTGTDQGWPHQAGGLTGVSEDAAGDVLALSSAPRTDRFSRGLYGAPAPIWSRRTAQRASRRPEELWWGSGAATVGAREGAEVTSRRKKELRPRAHEDAGWVQPVPADIAAHRVPATKMMADDQQIGGQRGFRMRGIVARLERERASSGRQQ